MMLELVLTSRDPVVTRDGRPFGANSGRRMKALGWLLPSVVAGSVRTMLGKELGGQFGDSQFRDMLKAIEVAGPFPVAMSESQQRGDMFLPAPADVRRGDNQTCVIARPVTFANGGTDLPAGLRPVCWPAGTAAEKLDPPPVWWTKDAFGKWLAAQVSTALSGFFHDAERFRASPDVETRTHVEIDPNSFAAGDGLLFSTAGLILDGMKVGERSVDMALTVRVRANGSLLDPILSRFPLLHPVGGERRLVGFDWERETGTRWNCPQSVADALTQWVPPLGVRMVLATPAVFTDGWRPGWLKNGTPPGGPPGLRLKLVGVCNSRAQAVSGWSYETNGPKAIRRVVPAGAVYFFEVSAGSATDVAALAGRWLESVSDHQDDRTDGFGLAAWGVWLPEEE
jgi:CRISPR-associated protein Cmr3